MAQNSSSINSFIPRGYVLMDTLSGNLNLDKYSDKLLIIKRIGEDTAQDSPDRPLLILLGQEKGAYQLAARCDKAVLCFQCGGVFGDPYQQMVIKNGYFSIEHYGGSNWRWSRIITFKYVAKAKKWYLHQDGGGTYHTAEPDKIETEIKTTKDFGIVPFEKYKY